MAVSTTEAANGIPTLVARRALTNLQTNSVLSRLVARDWDSEVAEYGNAVKIVGFGPVTTSLKAPNTAYTLQSPNDSATTVTLNKHRHFSFVIEDTARLFARPDYLAGLIDKGVKQMAADIDGDIAALYTTFTGTYDAAGTVDGVAFRKARTALSKALAPQGDRRAVLHPDAVDSLLGSDNFIKRGDAATQSSDSGSVSGFLGSYMGFDIYEDQNIKVVTAKAQNMFFHRDAIALVVRPLDAPRGETGVMSSTQSADGISLRVMMQYDISQGGYRVVCDCLYGVAALRPAFGVTVASTSV